MYTFFYWLTFLLLVVGGLNWLFVAWDYNLVEKIVTNESAIDIIYVLVGLSALYQLLLKICVKE